MRLFLARVRRVVGADTVNDALRNTMPEAVTVVGIADWRIKLCERAKPLVTLRARRA